MTRQEFESQLADVLEANAPLTADTKLAEVTTWDSLSQLSVIAFVMDALQEAPDPQRLADCQTVGDLVDLVQHRFS